MSKHSKATGFHPVRHDRLIKERVHDAYKQRHKLPEPTVCPQCGAVFHHGRWQWGPHPLNPHEEICPACHRIHDRFPAGFVQLSGEFFTRHRAEIMHLVKNEGEREGAEHPLERIMDTEGADSGVLVTTTSIHLARRIGEAVHKAYTGELEFHYNSEDKLLRVHWQR